MCHTDDPSNKQSEPPVRGTFLVTVSAVLAVWIELTTLEGGISWRYVEQGNILAVLVIKAICVTIILTPLVIYTVINGLCAIKYVKGRVIFIMAIILLRLAGRIYLFLHM
jgi:hypothetical protein